MPPFDPAATAERAVLELDKDGDGEVSMNEAKSSPALADSFSRFDQDNNSKITKAELTAKFESYKAANVALFHWSCQVTSGGRPLAGAQVSLVPEPFLGEQFRRATGVTDQSGTASPVIDEASLNGVRFGLYQIVISKKDAAGKETLPEQYNEKTILGQEVAAGVRSAESMRVISIPTN